MLPVRAMRSVSTTLWIKADKKNKEVDPDVMTAHLMAVHFAKRQVWTNSRMDACRRVAAATPRSTLAVPHSVVQHAEIGAAGRPAVAAGAAQLVETLGTRDGFQLMGRAPAHHQSLGLAA